MCEILKPFKLFLSRSAAVGVPVGDAMVVRAVLLLLLLSRVPNRKRPMARFNFTMNAACFRLVHPVCRAVNTNFVATDYGNSGQGRGEPVGYQIRQSYTNLNHVAVHENVVL